MSSVIYTNADDVEEAYYDAIGRGDLDALMNVWADDEEVVCIHPTGPRLNGALAIRESWRTIFANNPRLTVRITQTTRWKSAMLEVHAVIETLYVGNEPTPHGPMLTTNVFQRGANGWRLLAHHSSAAAEAMSSASETSDTTRHTLH